MDDGNEPPVHQALEISDEKQFQQIVGLATLS